MSDENNEFSTQLLEEKALGEYSLKRALKYVKEDIIIRDSGEELKKLVEEKNVSIKELKVRFGEVNISNWLRGKTISREKAIELCFVLKLDIFEAEAFLQKICGHDWFHLRDYKDIIFYFCLSNELLYERAITLIEKYYFLDSVNPDQPQDKRNQSVTNMIKQEITDYETEEELCDFLDCNQDLFGSLNNTAYKYFKQLFDKVQKKETEYHISELKLMKYAGDNTKYDSENVSFGEICEIMRIGIPYNLKKDHLTPLQQALYEDAPNRSTLVDTYNRKADKNGKIKQITRKPLIILWMMANEVKEFMPRIMIINQILEECGMPKLDSKNPFDWIVINSLETDGIVRMEEIIRNIFDVT